MKSTELTGARRLLAIAALPLLSVLTCTDALAKKTQVDFGLDNSPPSNNVNGEAWTFSSAACTTSPPAPASCLLDFTSITNSGKVDIGFSVNIGGTTYTQVFVNKNGILTFATGLGAFVAAETFGELTTTVAGANNPFIAAFYPSSELAIPKVSSPSDLGSLGGAEYGRGTANPAGTDGPNNEDLSKNVAAFKATWVRGPTPSPGCRCSTIPSTPASCCTTPPPAAPPATSTSASSSAPAALSTAARARTVSSVWGWARETTSRSSRAPPAPRRR